MTILTVYVMSVTGASELDLNRWCSHHLINPFSIKAATVYMDQTPRPVLNVEVIGTKDRNRLRESYDIIKTFSHNQFFERGEIPDES